jgi:iron complex outermembrane receptor protein
MQVRKNVLTLSIVAVLGMAGTVHAQDQKPADQKAKDLDTVVVTGIRGAQEKSLDTKRDANARIEVVTAEDVGKLPAHNVADTLQRLPGVNISSSSADEGGFDEADRVSLRGTSPSLTQTLINGHSVGSADWFVLSQGNNVGRSVSYTLLPSELVSSVRVYKSSEAKFQEGGTTGNVNIITRKPLEFAKPLTLEASVGMVRSDQADANDPQLSGLFNYRNDTNTFGVMVQAFSQKRSLRRDAQEIVGGWVPYTGAAGSGIDNTLVPELIGATLFQQERDRKGGLVSMQFKPSDNVTLGVEGFHSKMKANNLNNNFMMIEWNFASNPTDYTVKDGVMTNAYSEGAPGWYGVFDEIIRDSNAKSSYYTFDLDWDINENVKARFQAGTTKGVGATPRQYIAEVVVAPGATSSTSYDYNGSNAPLDWDITGDMNPANGDLASQWGNQATFAEDKENWATADFSQYFDGSALSSLDYGIRYAKHSRESTSPSGGRVDNAAFWAALKNAPTVAYPSNFASGLGNKVPQGIQYYDVNALKAALIANSGWVENDDGATGFRNYGAEWKVDEKNIAAYIQANFEGEGWSGNAGVRYVHISQDILNYTPASTTADADVVSQHGQWNIAAHSNSFTKLLPSANLKFDLADDKVFRLAASQTMTLPDYSAIGAALWGSELTHKGGGGNPDLKPVVSTNFDAAYEWYFMPRGLFSVSVYAMHLKDYVGFGTTTKQIFSEGNNQLEDYEVSVPINVGGDVRGFELAYQQPLGDNFGFDANYTYADGKVNQFTWADGSDNLTGTSKNTYNLGVWFENDRFGARVGYTYRDAFLIGLSQAKPFYQDDFGTVSASLSWKATDWLSVSFDALNLNNPMLVYRQTSELPSKFYSNGRQYYLNFRFKF